MEKVQKKKHMLPLNSGLNSHSSRYLLMLYSSVSGVSNTYKRSHAVDFNTNMFLRCSHIAGTEICQI